MKTQATADKLEKTDIQRPSKRPETHILLILAVVLYVNIQSPGEYITTATDFNTTAFLTNRCG